MLNKVGTSHIDPYAADPFIGSSDSIRVVQEVDTRGEFLCPRRTYVYVYQILI
jgi:hypothetical protein